MSPFGVCAMVVVELREVATQLAKLLAALLMAEVNVHFTYPLLTHPRGFAALALHVDDTDCAVFRVAGRGVQAPQPRRHFPLKAATKCGRFARLRG